MHPRSPAAQSPDETPAELAPVVSLHPQAQLPPTTPFSDDTTATETTAVTAATETATASEGPEAPRARAVAGGTMRRRPLVWLWVVALVVLVADQATKAWALAALSSGQRVALLGDVLGLVLVRNPGAAFSIASGQTWLFSLIAIVVTVVVVRVSRKLASRPWALALGLVLGGAVGNLIDRLVRSPGIFRGHVIDFIDYAGYFVGNVADIAIVAAAGVIIVLSVGGWEMDGTRATGARPSRSAAWPAGDAAGEGSQ